MSNFMDSLGIYWYKINEKTGERTKIPFEMTDSEDSDDFTDKDEGTPARRLLKDPKNPNDLYEITPELKLRFVGNATSILQPNEQQLFDEMHEEKGANKKRKTEKAREVLLKFFADKELQIASQPEKSNTPMPETNEHVDVIKES